jgi:hypothetical protein
MCKRAWSASSFGEFSKLSDAKEPLHARCATIHHRAHLGAVLRPVARTPRGSSARLPPTTHPRQGIPDRVVFEKLVQVLVFGCAYLRVADEECSASTLRRRREEWIEAGTMDALERIAKETYDRTIGLELSDIAVDCCITKAPCGGERSGRSPVDRGKSGIKRSVVVDAQGIPLGALSAPAKPHHSPLLLGETLDAAWRRSWVLCPSQQGCIWTAATTRGLLASAWQNAI